MSDPSSIKRSLSAQFSVEVPPPLDHTDPELLAELLLATKNNAASLGAIVIDVRLPEEFATGSIAGSWNIPHCDFVASDVVARVQQALEGNANSQSVRIVFASLQSPDVDEAVAQEFLDAWRSTVGSKDAAPPAVSLLLGGIFYWLRLYRTSTDVTSNYDKSTWDVVLDKEDLTSA